ncbi:MAG: class I SAM-dependent methyltransferase [Candidatus Methanoperedens sp.]|nr:class I SAM-dependent methyltransferase [Candidatus Methanoperedens sp.]
MSLKNEKEIYYKKAQMGFFNNFSKKTDASKDKDLFYRFFVSMDEKKVRYAEDSIVEIIGKIPSRGLILELGCGRGEHTLFAASIAQDIKIVSIDTSLESIKTSKKILKNQNIEDKVSFVLCDAENLPFHNKTFDGVMAIMILHHVPNIHRALDQVNKAMKDDGMGVIVELTSDNPARKFLIKVFKFLPKGIKGCIDNDYLLDDCDIPMITSFRAETLKRNILQNNLTILRQEKHSLFSGYIYMLFQVIPLIKILFSERRLIFLFSLESFLLEKTFLKRFGGAVVYWITKQ